MKSVEKNQISNKVEQKSEEHNQMDKQVDEPIKNDSTKCFICENQFKENPRFSSGILYEYLNMGYLTKAFVTDDKLSRLFHVRKEYIIKTNNSNHRVYKLKLDNGTNRGWGEYDFYFFQNIFSYIWHDETNVDISPEYLSLCNFCIGANYKDIAENILQIEIEKKLLGKDHVCISTDLKGIAANKTKYLDRSIKIYDRANEDYEEPFARKEELKQNIINLLLEKAVKMPASDIDAFLKHQNVDEIKELCEQMYHNGEISRTANYRYFVLTEEKKQSKKASAPKSEAVDVKAELKKYKEMLDEGLITQEAYDAKMNQLLGL